MRPLARSVEYRVAAEMITIAICTWNRALRLGRALHSIQALQPAPQRWEVLVVNNNSTDSTEDVLRQHAQSLPLRWVTERKQGIAWARNRVLAEAHGDVILWFDDDMTVAPGWYAAYQRAFHAYPEAGLFGGRIHHRLDDDVPPDVRRQVEAHFHALIPILGELDFGPELRPLQPGELFFSGNMALRTEIARRYGFDARLGRVGGASLMGGEETILLRRMLADGVPGVWVGTASAEHHIEASRLTPLSIWNHFQAVGRTQARIDGIPDCPTLRGRPRWAQLQLWRNCLKSRLWREIGQDWLPAYLTAAKLAGYLEECDANRERRVPGYLVPPLRNNA